MAMVWADPPTVVLRLNAEHRPGATPRPQPMLDDYIDMGPFGPSNRGQSPGMAVTITAPPRLDLSAAGPRPARPWCTGAAIRIPRRRHGPVLTAVQAAPCMMVYAALPETMAMSRE
jgi:hypothetical protein